jgi:hypothetical protein
MALLTSTGGGALTTFAADRQAQKLAEIDARERRAWQTYRDSLRALEGRSYEDVEKSSWERLQEELRSIGDERELAGKS